MVALGPLRGNPRGIRGGLGGGRNARFTGLHEQLREACGGLPGMGQSPGESGPDPDTGGSNLLPVGTSKLDGSPPLPCGPDDH